MAYSAFEKSTLGGDMHRLSLARHKPRLRGPIVALMLGLMSSWGFAAEITFESAQAKIDTQGWAAAKADFEKLAASGDSPSQYALGVMYLSGTGVRQDSAVGASWVKKAALGGHWKAQVHLGDLYKGGDGLPQDDSKAAHWYRTAAEAGSPEGQAEYGTLFLEGRGVRQDTAQALMWLNRAADQKNPMAHYNIGVIYFNGIGIQKNQARGMEWLERAANLGSRHAYVKLAGMYGSGVSGVVDKNPEKALRYARISAEQNMPLGVIMLCTYLKNNFGGNADPREALTWCSRAAEQGDAGSMNMLALLYYSGDRGVPKSNEKFLHWTRKAAEHGDSQAQFNLAVTYYKGELISRDFQAARHWAEKSAVQGDPNARELLALLSR